MCVRQTLTLLSQTLTEGTLDSEFPLHGFAVFSDSDVRKHRKFDDDIVHTFSHELRNPATAVLRISDVWINSN